MPLPALAGIALSVVFPSAAIVHKYGGDAGAIGYLVAATLLIRHCAVAIGGAVAQWRARVVAAAAAVTVVALAGAFAVLHPVANSGTWGPGSDRDEALNAATSEWLAGRYPYAVTTYLDNPPGTLPGALVLAMPFTLAGNAAYQNLFWIGVLLLAATGIYGAHAGLALWWTLLLFSPEVLHEFVVGGDLVANAIYVPVAVLWLMSACRADRSLMSVAAPAAFLGICLASRANFFVLLPIVFVALARRGGVARASAIILGVVLVMALLIAPFYLYAPDVFSPFRTANKFTQLSDVMPGAGLILPVVAGVLACVLAVVGATGSTAGLLRRSAVALAVPVVLATAVEVAGYGSTAFAFSSYGLSAVVFGGLGFWPSLLLDQPA